jgi:K+-transporting ATPase ATPase B chain
MSSKETKSKFITKEIANEAIAEAFKKLDPRYMIKNPVMFIVEIGFFISILLTIAPNLFGDKGNNLRIYNLIVAVILFITVLFANFAESIAEGRGKAQAESLKKTRKDTIAKLLDSNGNIKVVSSNEIKKGDIVLVENGDIIPNDGEIIAGIASVDESAITGESAPVMKEAGGDFASVTGGTKVVSDWLKVEVTVTPGESFLDKMIALVEGASRQKTPNEIALNTLLVSLTLIFLIVIVTLYPIAGYSGVRIQISTLIALLVCLIPTTIGGLLSAIGIAGMDRVTRFNVIALSGKAVEACGDVDTMILDKTGTITFGNRLAAEFIPVGGASMEDLIKYSVISSLKDDTPEGKSIVELGKKLGQSLDYKQYEEGNFIEFTAQTRMSGIDLKDGTIIRKGAGDAIKNRVKELGGQISNDLEDSVNNVSKAGGTPLVVCVGNKIYGVIYLKDTVKPGLAEKFVRLREIGIKTVMCTGDNPLTAATIAKEAGVDGFIAECKPEDKIKAIMDEQAEGKLVAMTGDGTNDAPALAKADVGLAMNSGTTAAKEAANMVDLDSDPTKILEIVEIGKQLLITRGALTTFSIANDVAKYFAIIPAIFTIAIPKMQILNVMRLSTPYSAILSALIFNAIIIPLLIPIAMRGVKYKPMKSEMLLLRNMLVFGLGGMIVPFIGIKIIDMMITPVVRILNLG